jgi:hypothetical protein
MQWLCWPSHLISYFISTVVNTWPYYRKPFIFVLRLEQEQSLKKEIEENFIAFKKKVEFDQKVQLEQQSELRQRLEMSTSTIFGLESKIKQLGKTDTNIPELLKQVREAAEVELRKYQSESEQQISKSVSDIILFLF